MITEIGKNVFLPCSTLHCIDQIELCIIHPHSTICWVELVMNCIFSIIFLTHVVFIRIRENLPDEILHALRNNFVMAFSKRTPNITEIYLIKDFLPFDWREGPSSVDAWPTKVLWGASHWQGSDSQWTQQLFMVRGWICMCNREWQFKIWVNQIKNFFLCVTLQIVMMFACFTHVSIKNENQRDYHDETTSCLRSFTEVT